MDTIEALKTRRSVRAYYLKPVDKAVLEDIVDCARLAPSGMNAQAWDFVLVTDQDMRDDVADTCGTAPFLSEAAAFVAVVAPPSGLYQFDTACAATCLMVAARAYEVGSCWFHLVDKPYEPEVRELLGVPDDRRIITIIALGYGELPPAPDKRPLADVLHREKWAQHAQTDVA